MEFKSAAFRMPELSRVAAALRSGLGQHYASVDVALVECPDLKKLGAAASGLCGSTRLIEFGGEPCAHNPAFRGTGIDVDEVLRACGVPGASVFGAGMADTAVNNGHCGELIPNMLEGGRNLSRVARVGPERECIVEPYPSPVCGPIANLFVSEGQNGEVVRIDVRTRTGEQPSLPQAIRDSLRPIADSHGHLGMGGLFQVLSGRVRSHVMPDYGCIGFDYYDTGRERVVRDFLQFYEHMGPDLLCFSTLWTGDPTGGDLHLRPSGEHTHFFHVDDAAQQGGHYHGDITPGEVHYLGFFNLAERILRFGDIYEELGSSP
ncbi:MAG: DUF1907 domain-containing protein [Gammaproteobacteria bacterium]|nr:DUF1907 domain-containing protein [Gammaproteobacteria bacterium]MDE0366305.1 DUF1907 domain-containing protein [Gammaproteobacteria bacterium]